MKTHDLIQGSPEWLAYRAQHFNASDAPAMMGCSPYKTRAALLRELHTGVAADVDIATQKRFDNGHRAEALARPLAEKIIGEDLYPVTGSEGRLSASFDGLTLDESTAFEHKALNADLKAAFAAIESLVGGGDEAPGRLLPIYHRVQMEQQLHVSGAGRVLFMATKWTPEGELVEEHSVWYLPDDELRGAILAGWDQFARDLAAYVVPQAAEPAPAGKAPETLPALRIEVTGQVTASNLAEFKETALAAIRSVNRELKTDGDFADARKAIKWCEDIETRIDGAKQHALSQTATIDALFKTMDDIKAEARAVRLDLKKLDERRGLEIREHAIVAARQALDMHVAVVNAEIAPMRLLPVVADFAGAIKGKRSVASMQDALDTTLAAAKIAADAQGRAIRINLAVFEGVAKGFEFLFADLSALVHKPADDFATLVDARITTHKAAEERKARERAEAEARAAEQRRQQEEAAARAAQEAAAKAAAAAELLAAQQSTQGQTLSPAAQALNEAQGAARFAAAHPAIARQQPAQAPAPAPAPRADEPATLTLGVICERLGFTVRAEFVADALHVKPAAMPVKGRGLYTETQFRTICRQLVSHVGAMAELYAAEVTA